MPRALDTSSLPKVLATALWPWIDIVEAAKAGMGDRVRMTAENTVVLLRREIEASSPLETAMEDALLASDTLAQDLDRVTFFQTDARTEALLALNGLIAWLQTARLKMDSRGVRPS
ncbi:hypothetical protein [Methylobacterium sp. J-076]|uniref:hypothetical protein n=1 Tax=Methylobacterium sp. J-076 TaxID=2836655 RepID=UPI001FBAE293|nr:hypothetical protein [Methylobacterium sp. J-076]MCJ2012676.1 hypothetical protein [Methylobacterium sp. J-076]